jgi:hypothetical protein
MAKAEENKYAGREYLDYAEAGDYLGIKRATLFNYINDLEIQTYKFKRDRRRYLAIADVKRIEEVLDKPWLAGLDEEEKSQQPEEQTKPAKGKLREAEKEPVAQERPWYLPEQKEENTQAEEKSEPDAA